MRTNIDIDDKLMDYVMATGDFKTKREAVEAGLQLIKRRHAYAAIRAARGTLFWDDSDEAWARSRAEAEAVVAPDAENLEGLAVHEPAAIHAVPNPSATVNLPTPAAKTRKRRKPTPGIAA